MKSKLVYLRNFSGEETSVYSIITDDRSGTMLDRFIDKYKSTWYESVISIAQRLKAIGKYGADENLFKMDEGLSWDDQVCALYDIPDKFLRLYCIRLYNRIVIIGNGGPKSVRAWQDDPKLSREVYEMIHYSKIIRAKLNNGSLRLSADGLKFEGNLILTY